MIPCSKCRDPLGLVSYTIGVWIGDDLQAEAQLCASCGGVLGNPAFMTDTYRAELEAGR